MFFWKVVGTSFLRISAPFWEASGVKSRKNEVPERCQKTAPNKELREREKVMREHARGGWGSLKQFHIPPRVTMTRAP